MIERAYDSPVFRFGAVGPLVVSFYRGATTKAQLEQLDAFQTQLLATHGRIMSLSVMGQVAATVRLDDEARTFSADLATKYEQTNVGTVMVVKSTGLGAVVVRSFLSAWFLMRQTQLKVKVTRTVAEGLEWLNALPEPNPIRQVSVTAEEIDAFCEAP